LQKLQLHYSSDIPGFRREFMPIRDRRADMFNEKWLATFSDKFGQNFMYDEKKYCYTIQTSNQDNKPWTLDFYPKANKVLIRQENRWIKPGLNWLLDTFITKVE